MKREAVQVGQHYHSTEGGYFGGPGPEWEVVSVAELNDGVTCARLARPEIRLNELRLR